MSYFVKRMLTVFRNTLAFSYAWTVLCSAVIVWGLGGGSLSVGFLFKLLALCAWGSACFAGCFFNSLFDKKGFIFCLTLFYILFLPVEIFIYYSMGLFVGGGSPLVWIIFWASVISLYMTAILIDRLIFKRRGAEYTQKLKEYNESK
jgi:hypothetical protein